MCLLSDTDHCRWSGASFSHGLFVPCAIQVKAYLPVFESYHYLKNPLTHFGLLPTSPYCTSTITGAALNYTTVHLLGVIPQVHPVPHLAHHFPLKSDSAGKNKLSPKRMRLQHEYQDWMKGFTPNSNSFLQLDRSWMWILWHLWYRSPHFQVCLGCLEDLSLLLNCLFFFMSPMNHKDIFCILKFWVLLKTRQRTENKMEGFTEILAF